MIRIPAVFALILLSGALLAAPQFPELTGRVVDNANLLSARAERTLAERLAGHERAGGNQVVVVTLPDLGGYTIEEYGYQLGRHWGIGQKGEDNGVLLIVAQDERRVRIEVGYGLEGVLTDALSSNIIHAVILPAFRKGQFEEGIVEGAAAIVAALGGEYQPRETGGGEREQIPVVALLAFLMFGGVFSLLSLAGGGRRRGGLYPVVWGGGLGGGGFGGGGFGGGGGGFGGGGASGGW